MVAAEIKSHTTLAKTKYSTMEYIKKKRWGRGGFNNIALAMSGYQKPCLTAARRTSAAF
jgi:hypothetical protein